MKINISSKNTILFFATILVSASYYLFNHPTNNLHILSTNLDNQIPFISTFVIPYIIFIPLFWLIFVYAFLTNDKNFKTLAITIIIIHLISYLIYALYQTYIPRPYIIENGLTFDLVRWIYSHDAPYNDFPSLHSTLATILAMFYLKNKWNWVIIFFAIIVILSTLFIKQHFIVDALGGIFLGMVVYLIVSYKKA